MVRGGGSQKNDDAFYSRIASEFRLLIWMRLGDVVKTGVLRPGGADPQFRVRGGLQVGFR